MARTKVICVSHKEDADGIGAASLIRQAFGGETKLVDDFVINSTDAEILGEIGKLDMEARLLGISFYDMYCVVLQDVAGHQNLVSQFKIFMQSRKTN